MALPALTPEQRTAALDAAARARRTRAEVADRLRRGRGSLAQVLAAGRGDDAVGRMRVSALLGALPGVGPVTVAAVMDEVGIAPARRVRGLGPRQAAALAERFEAACCGHGSAA